MLSEKIINFCKRAEAFSFYGLIFFFPLSIAFSEVFATFTLVFFFVKRWTIFIKVFSTGGRVKKVFFAFLEIVKPVKSPLSHPLGFFILVCGAFIFFSQYPSLSIKGFFFKVLQWTYLYFVFIEFMTEKRQIKIFMNVFLVSMAVVFLNGLFQYFFGKDLIFGEVYVDRLYSCLRHANDFGAYLVITCPVILSAVFFQDFSKKSIDHKETIFKVFPGILFVVGYFCLGMTLSRGAWIGFLGAMVFLGYILFSRRRRTWMMTFFIAIFFFLTFSSVLNNLRGKNLISDSNKSLVETIRDDSLSSDSDSFPEKVLSMFKKFNGSDRMRYWGQALRIIKQSPIIGNGLNTYTPMAAKNPMGTGGYPHNCYLQMAAEIGILGLGVFFWVIFALFRSSLKNIPKMKDPFLLCVVIGLLSGLFGFLIHASLDTILYSVQLGNLMWVVMGVIVASQQIDLAAQKS
ncbi:MAG: O-antigen ligase family protein [Candidatus Omnitrophota bacterium]